jgi:hypothetical protein
MMRRRLARSHPLEKPPPLMGSMKFADRFGN